MYKRPSETSMALFQRRIHWLVPTFLIIIITFTIWRPGFGHGIQPRPPPPPPPPPPEKPLINPDEKPKEEPAPEPPVPTETGWEFSLERDEVNFGLSDQQCQVCS